MRIDCRDATPEHDHSLLCKWCGRTCLWTRAGVFRHRRGKDRKQKPRRWPDPRKQSVILPNPPETRVVPGFPCYAITKVGAKLYSNYVYGSHPPRLGEWTLVRHKTRIVKGVMAHPYADLFVDGKATRFPIHVLVLMAWIGPRPEGMQCCHFDDNRFNNDLSNLRWDTVKANTADAFRNGRIPVGENSVHATITNEQVLEVRRRASEGEDLSILADWIGKRRGYVRRIVRREIWTHI